MVQRPRFQVFRPVPERDEADMVQARARVSHSAELLKQSAPDTFLGRKTQEPFEREKAKAALTDREERFLKVLEQRYAHSHLRDA